MPLNPHIHKFLLGLEKYSGAGCEWVAAADFSEIPAEQRVIAVRAGWVKERTVGQNREYKILASGYTALGDNAEFAIKVMKGEAQPIPVVEPEISVSIYGERMGEDTPAHRRAKRPASESTTCAVDGCDEPKYLTHSRCHPHMKAYWRDKAKETRLNKSGSKRAAKRIVAPDPFITLAAEEPPIVEEDTERDLPPVVDTPPVSPVTRILAHAAIKGIVLLHRVKGTF